MPATVEWGTAVDTFFLAQELAVHFCVDHPPAFPRAPPVPSALAAEQFLPLDSPLRLLAPSRNATSAELRSFIYGCPPGSGRDTSVVRLLSAASSPLSLEEDLAEVSATVLPLPPPLAPAPHLGPRVQLLIGVMSADVAVSARRRIRESWMQYGNVRWRCCSTSLLFPCSVH